MKERGNRVSIVEADDGGNTGVHSGTVWPMQPACYECIFDNEKAVFNLKRVVDKVDPS